MFILGRGSSSSETVRLNVVGRKGSKRSIVWKFWEHPKGASGNIDITVIQCSLCGIRKKYCNSTTVLMDHLKRSHYSALLSASSSCTSSDRLTTPGSTSTAGTTSTTVTSTIDSFFHRVDKYKRPSKRSDEIDRSLGYAIVRDLLPLSESCGEGLTHFAKTLDPKYFMPSDKYIKNSVLLPMYFSTKKALKEELKDIECLCMTSIMFVFSNKTTKM